MAQARLLRDTPLHLPALASRFGRLQDPLKDVRAPEVHDAEPCRLLSNLEPAVGRTTTLPTWSVNTMSDSRALSLSEDKKETEHERDTSLEVDVEKNGPHKTLQRQVSGPPYSVFSKGMKIWIIFLVSISALISPFGAATVLPALNVLTGVLDITPTKANISVTTYMVRAHTSVYVQG